MQKIKDWAWVEGPRIAGIFSQITQNRQCISGKIQSISTTGIVITFNGKKFQLERWDIEKHQKNIPTSVNKK